MTERPYPLEPAARLLHALADGRFHSGEELAAASGVSRAAIWKQVSRLRDDLGLDVHAVRGRGYRLAQPLELLDAGTIQTHLSELASRGSGEIAGIEIFDRIDSTNQYLLDRGAAGAASGLACLAEFQSAGRGRRGRRWVSPFGANLYLSLLWRFPGGPGQLSGLSLALGVAVAQALEAAGARGIGLKWPNDLLWQGRKLAGLLLEVAGEHAGPSRVVAGVGVNLRLPAEQGRAIDQPWADLSQVAAQTPGMAPVSRNRLAALLLERMAATMAGFERGGFAPLAGEWLRLDLHYQHPVRIQQGDHWIDGIHRGVDVHGALLLESGGRLLTLHGGELSLRPTGEET